MTGAYLRVFREDGYVNIEVEHLSNEERQDAFIHRTPEEIVRWLNLVCNTLSEVETSDDFIIGLIKEKEYLEYKLTELEFQLEERNNELDDLQKTSRIL